MGVNTLSWFHHYFQNILVFWLKILNVCGTCCNTGVFWWYMAIKKTTEMTDLPIYSRLSGVSDGNIWPPCTKLPMIKIYWHWKQRQTSGACMTHDNKLARTPNFVYAVYWRGVMFSPLYDLWNGFYWSWVYLWFIESIWSARGNRLMGGVENVIADIFFARVVQSFFFCHPSTVSGRLFMSLSHTAWHQQDACRVDFTWDKD